MRAKRIVPAILALVFFFCGWMQFYHRHDAVDYLNHGDSTYRVIIVGAHSHSSDTDFPLFENLRIVIKPVLFNCLLCTFDRWLFLRSSVNEAVFISTDQKLGRITTELDFKGKASINYYLRAPPVFFPFS